MDLATILWILLAIALTAIASTIGAFLIFRGVLRRRLRLHPKRKSAVPSHWLANPRAPAQAHRRLRAATARARYEVASLTVGSKGSSDPALLADAIDDLHRRAYELEQVLLSNSRVPRSSRQLAMTTAWAELFRIEQTVGQVSSAAAAWRQAILRPESLDDQTDMLTFMNLLDDVATRLSNAKEPPARPVSAPVASSTGFHMVDLDD